LLALVKYAYLYETNYSKNQKIDKLCITVTVFNTSFTTIPRCTAATVEQVYANIEPNSNTDLVDPLVDRLNNAFAKHQSDKHPVITT
jgi:hypothetical protein